MGMACCVALIANVYRHGWHLAPVLTGACLTGLILSLGVRPERRTMRWEVQYVTATVFLVGLAAFRFIR